MKINDTSSYRVQPIKSISAMQNLNDGNKKKKSFVHIMDEKLKKENEKHQSNIDIRI